VKIQNGLVNLPQISQKTQKRTLIICANQRHLREPVRQFFIVDATLMLEIKNETDPSGFCEWIVSRFDPETEIGAYVERL